MLLPTTAVDKPHWPHRHGSLRRHRQVTSIILQSARLSVLSPRSSLQISARSESARPAEAGHSPAFCLMLHLCGSHQLLHSPLNTKPRPIRPASAGPHLQSRSQHCRAAWHSTSSPRQRRQHSRPQNFMEDPQLLLPKVAWPARGGKEIIYRAASPRDPGHLDDISTDIGPPYAGLARSCLEHFS